MKRRDVLRATTLASAGSAGAAGLAAAETPTEGETASDGTPTPDGTGTPMNGTQTGNATATATPSGGATETVAVGPGGEFVFRPGTEEPLEISPGTTVRFVWESDNHNIVVDSQPGDADWPGMEELKNTGFEYEYTFEVPGTYEYFCQPHKAAGMVGTIVVEGAGGGGGGGGGGGEQDPHEMGVPWQAQYVGIATLLGMIVSLVFTFYVLKYGESPHASGGN
jgi:plastocyanin